MTAVSSDAYTAIAKTSLITKESFGIIRAIPVSETYAAAGFGRVGTESQIHVIRFGIKLGRVFQT